MLPLIVLEMNEINYLYVENYIQRGYLVNFRRFFDEHGYCETTSETSYDILEPWIQWVSARTGKTYSEHKIFRLGDIVNSDVEQYWEALEKNGYTVSAVSPINGVNRTHRSPFWIPDPWVDTHASGGMFLEKITAAIKQAVNDNASEKLSFQTKLTLIQAMLTKTNFSSWPVYLSGILGVLRRRHWSKAVVLDRLLADLFFKLWRQYKPDFSTLFLNSAAHIQHHYMFNSKAYDGAQKNPEWYVSPEADPVLEIYELYDAILGDAMKSGARIMVATGLTQIPYEKVTFYYRLKDHEKFLSRHNVPFSRVLPRMSRDFLLECSSADEAKKATELLEGFRSAEGDNLFEVDNRGDSLFVTLIYPHEIKHGFKMVYDGKVVVNDFYEDVAFVAIKNGHHDSNGYFMDSAVKPGELPDSIPLERLYELVMSHFSNEKESARVA